jgi:Uma2 family endonuclease
MGEAGIFGDDKRIELIDGEIIKLAPIGPRHSNVGIDLQFALYRVLGQEFSLRHEVPITIVEGTEPQPDLAVAIGPSAKYDDRHPLPIEILLVAEVSDSSLASDRKRKLGLYASSGISEFWIVNLVDRQLEIYRKPAGDTYSETAVLTLGDMVPLSFAVGKSIAVSDFLR